MANGLSEEWQTSAGVLNLLNNFMALPTGVEPVFSD